MSVEAVNLKNNSHATNNSTPSTGTWKGREVQDNFSGPSFAEISRLVLRSLGLAMAGGGIATLAAVALGAATWPFALIAIPCALGAAATSWYSLQFDNYENPEELAKFRDDATPMSLEKVMQTHGWDTVLRWGIISAEQFSDKFRLQMRGKNLIEIIDSYEKAMHHISQCSYRKFDYHVPAPSEWREQWHSETAVKTFEEIIQTYPLDKLEKYNLLESGELRRIKELKTDYEKIKANYDGEDAKAEKGFQRNTTEHQERYQSDCEYAQYCYNNDESVKRLKVFEIENLRERQAVQETASRRKAEARTRFENAIAEMTNRGLISYERLSSKDKALYDQHNNAMQLSIVQADNEARTQFANIDARRIEEKNRLNQEESRVKAVREAALKAAKDRYDSATSSHLQHKKEEVAPSHIRFRGAVDDLNGRYRAYLRTIGVLQ